VFERLKAARAEVAQSPGALLSDELAGVARSYRLFQGNAREFAAFHGRFDTDATARLELWDVKNRKLFEAFLGEVDRLLHNYLAAASTLRDHTRRLWRQYPPADPALIAEYDQRVRDAFTESPLVQFVQRLRNYSTHSQLPVSRGRLAWTRDSGDQSTVELSKAKLLEWDGWNAAARDFLESSADEIDLRVVVSEYTAVADDFNQWFARAFVNGHLAAFEDLNARKARFNELLARSGLVRPQDAQPDGP
jgi:hypothetical protein